MTCFSSLDPDRRRLRARFSRGSQRHDVYSSIEFTRVTLTGSTVAVSAFLCGLALNVGECLPSGAQVLDKPFLGIVTENDDLVDTWQRKVLLGEKNRRTLGEFTQRSRGANTEREATLFQISLLHHALQIVFCVRAYFCLRVRERIHDGHIHRPIGEGVPSRGDAHTLRNASRARGSVVHTLFHARARIIGPPRPRAPRQTRKSDAVRRRSARVQKKDPGASVSPNVRSRGRNES